VTSYAVHKSPADGEPTWTPAKTVPGTATSAAVTGLAKNTSWVFRVQAVNAGGPGPWSDPSAAVLVPATLPGAPRDLNGQPGANQVHLTWQPPADTGGLDITGYGVWRRIGTSGTWIAITANTGTPATNYTVTGLTAGTEYQFAIRARNTLGYGAYTATPSITVE
jgi:chitodextrinase